MSENSKIYPDEKQALEKQALEKLQTEYLKRPRTEDIDGVEEKPNFVDKYLQIKNKKLIDLVKTIGSENIYRTIHPEIRNEYSRYAYRRSITRKKPLIKKNDIIKVVKDHRTGYHFKLSKTQLFIYEVLKRNNLTFDFLFSDFDDYFNPESLLETKIENNSVETETKKPEEIIPEFYHLLKEINDKLDTSLAFQTRKKRQDHSNSIINLNFLLSNAKQLIIPVYDDKDIFSIVKKNSFFFSLLQYFSYSNSSYKRTMANIYIQNKGKEQNNVPFLEILFALQILFIELIIPLLKKKGKPDFLKDISGNLKIYFQISNANLKDFHYTNAECKQAKDFFTEFLEKIEINMNQDALLEFYFTGKVKFNDFLEIRINDLEQYTIDHKKFIESLRSTTRYELSQK